MNRNVSRTIIAVGAGIAVGYMLRQQVESKQKISPEKALLMAKDTFKKTGPISGSWIYMKPEEVHLHGLLYTAYRGGITRDVDGKNHQYEFYTDVTSGTVIRATQTE